MEFYNSKKDDEILKMKAAGQEVNASALTDDYFYIDTITGNTNIAFDYRQLERKRLHDFTIDNLTTTNITTKNQSE